MLEAVDKVTGHFPQITPEDLAGRLKIGVSRWRNSVQWTRQRLIMKGELDGSVRGIWKITDKGRARLEKEWSSWIPKYRKKGPLEQSLSFLEKRPLSRIPKKFLKMR